MWQVHEHGKRDGERPKGWLAKLIPALSLFTMAMTVPQVWSVWVEEDTSGVSLLSWGAYLLSGLLWFFYGLQKRDRTIWVACIGWIVLDAAVVVGVLWRG
jgi:uncharacterized protein with PQ loop repeat